ncbi:MAG: hypothetical protein HQL68_09690, partial [Magnetococcales bacterium]|nr:hypothetical protein [Magnetococcales bacterium]
ITKFNKTMKTKLSRDIATTVGGWLLHKVGELPGEGYKVITDGWHFTIVKVADNRILEIECRREKISDQNPVKVKTEKDGGNEVAVGSKPTTQAKKDVK